MGCAVSSVNTFTTLCRTELIFYLTSLKNTGLWDLHFKAEGISTVLTIIFTFIRTAHKQQQVKKKRT